MGHWNDITSTRGKVRSSCGKRNVNFLGEERGRKEKKRKKNRKFQIARTEKKKKTHGIPVNYSLHFRVSTR